MDLKGPRLPEEDLRRYFMCAFVRVSEERRRRERETD